MFLKHFALGFAVVLLTATTAPGFASFDRPVSFFVNKFPDENCIFCDPNEKHPLESVSVKKAIVRNLLLGTSQGDVGGHGGLDLEIAVSRFHGVVSKLDLLDTGDSFIPSFFARIGAAPTFCDPADCRLVLIAQLSDDEWTILMDERTASTPVIPSLKSGDTTFRIVAREFWMFGNDGRRCIYALRGVSSEKLHIDGTLLDVAGIALQDLIWWVTGRNPIYKRTDVCQESSSKSVY